jgi:hypothetical protein
MFCRKRNAPWTASPLPSSSFPPLRSHLCRLPPLRPLPCSVSTAPHPTRAGPPCCPTLAATSSAAAQLSFEARQSDTVVGYLVFPGCFFPVPLFWNLDCATMDSLRLSVIGGTIKYCSIIKIRAGGVVGLIHTSIIWRLLAWLSLPAVARTNRDCESVTMKARRRTSI